MCDGHVFEMYAGCLGISEFDAGHGAAITAANKAGFLKIGTHKTDIQKICVVKPSLPAFHTIEIGAGQSAILEAGIINAPSREFTVVELLVSQDAAHAAIKMNYGLAFLSRKGLRAE